MKPSTDTENKKRLTIGQWLGSIFISNPPFFIDIVTHTQILSRLSIIDNTQKTTWLNNNYYRLSVNIFYICGFHTHIAV